MLGAYNFRKRRYEEGMGTSERATRGNKREGMLWAAYAWCEWKRGKRTHAIEILSRGHALVPGDGGTRIFSPCKTLSG